MNYVQYEPETGKFVSCGNMTEETLDAVIAARHPIIRVTSWPADFDLRFYDVDLATMSLVRNSFVPPAPPPPPEPPPAPTPPRRSISDRQFFQQAALAGYISRTEALQAVQTGSIPAPLQAIVDTIQDADQKFDATMLLAGATLFFRDHPLVAQIGAAFGLTPEQIDDFFTSAETL